MQNLLSKPEDLMLQNATPLRKSPRWPPNIAPATRNASLRILFKCPTPAIVFGNATKPSRFAHFWQGAQSLAPATRNDIWTSKSVPNPSVFLHFWLRNVLRHNGVPKVLWERCVLYILAWKRASRHNGVAFCHHLNFQKWSETGSLLHFWRRMCFAPQRRATSCNFSSLIWPHGSAPAALASLLFDPPEPQIIGKNTVFRGFPPFLRTCIFFLLTLSLLWSSLFGSSPPWLSPPLLFHLSILSGSPGNDLLMVAFRS